MPCDPVRHLQKYHLGTGPESARKCPKECFGVIFGTWLGVTQRVLRGKSPKSLRKALFGHFPATRARKAKSPDSEGITVDLLMHQHTEGLLGAPIKKERKNWGFVLLGSRNLNRERRTIYHHRPRAKSSSGSPSLQ